MELRIIDGKPFIITRRGKAETATPTADVVAQARLRIQDAKHMLASLEQSKAEAQTSLEAALLKGEPAAPYRAEIANITELARDQAHEISDATADIEGGHQVLDHYKATQIRLADADALAALIKPFDNFLRKLCITPRSLCHQ